MKPWNALLLILILFEVSAAGSDPVSDIASEQSVENKTIAEDKLALAAYKGSVGALYKLIQAKKNTPQESALLGQYAESLNHMAAIQFRLIHSSTGDPSALVSEHNATLDRIIGVENILIRSQAQTSDAARSYFLRARAYKELGRDVEATQDLKFLLDRFPKSEDFLNAEFTLYEILVKNKDFKTAIQYLSKLEKDRSSSYYPMILDNLAFSHYSLKEIPTALEYLDKELALYPIEGNAPERTKILKNFALFYFSGIGPANGPYTVKGFLPSLARMKPGKSLNSILKYFLNLLRSKGMEGEIENFKHEVLTSNFGTVEIIDFVFTILESEVSKKDYAHLRESLAFLNRTLNTGSKTDKDPAHLVRFYKVLEDSASKLQEGYIKLQGTPNAQPLEVTLIEVYRLLIQLAEKQKAKLHFNLAEIYMQRKEFDHACPLYIWVVKSSTLEEKKSPLYDQARSKMISSRYESLAQKGAFPKDVQARKENVAPPLPLPVEVTEWIGWVSDAFQEKPSETLAVFLFEAARTLYSKGNIVASTQLLNRIIQLMPHSRYAVGSASLILDTEIVNEKWKDAYLTANSFLVKLPNAPIDFRNKLGITVSESFFKIAETFYQQGRYLDAIQQVDSFLKQFPNHHKRTDSLALAGNAALALKDKKKALVYLSPLLKENSQGKTVGTALLTQATLSEEMYDLENAVANYKRYLELPLTQREGAHSKEDAELKRKTLLLSWLSGNSENLKQTLASPVLCSREMASTCDKLKGYLELRSSNSHKTSGAHWRQADAGSKVIWATLALQNSESLSLDDRIQTMEFIISEWDHQDSLTKYNLLPFLSQALVRGLKQCGINIQRANPLALDKKRIARRTQGIEKLEGLAQKLTGLSWARIRVEAFHEWANLFASFSKDIESLPKPKELTGDFLKAYESTINELAAPFVKKASELRSQALKAGREAGIESESFLPIAQAAYLETPSLPGELKPSTGKVPNLNIYLEVLNKSQIEPNWLLSLNQAVRQKNILKVSYLIQEGQGRKLFRPEQENLAVGLSLVLVGAQAEGLASVKEGLPKFDAKLQAGLLLGLVLEFYSVRNVEKTRNYLTQFISTSSVEQRRSLLQPQDAGELLSAIAWTKLELSSELKNELSHLTREHAK